MAQAERLRVKATILEAGVAQTFKQYGEWTAMCQAEVSIEVLQEAVELRREADVINGRIKKSEIAQYTRRRRKHGSH